MKIIIKYDPVFHIIIKDVFSKDINKKILKEAIKNKKHFKPALISLNNILNKKIRSNTFFNYDDIYSNNRNESVLLEELENLFRSDWFRELMLSSPAPFNNFKLTNIHETQLSRYGNNNQKYEWHVDAFNDLRTSREITLVYYFNKEPKKFKGGSIRLSKSPLGLKDKNGNVSPIDKKSKQAIIKPDNNSLVIFSSNVAHMVDNTTSSNKFEDGRFSVNCWVGRQ